MKNIRKNGICKQGALMRLAIFAPDILAVAVFALAILALAMPGIAPALAQQGRGQPARSAPQQPAASQQPAAPSPEPEQPLPPYDPELVKLSDVMGSIAFLRLLCTGSEEPIWREKMAALMESEGRSTARRERLAAIFNRGYRSYALVYRSCTASAEEALVRLAREGETLSRKLAGRFGG